MLNLIFEKNKTMDVKPSINSATASVTKVTVDDENLETIPDQSELSDEERDFYRIMFGKDIASVRYQKLHCTACDVHIGSAPAKAKNMWAHPVLRTLLCAACREFYGDGNFEQGEDATDMFCRWCANGGNLYCCSFCSNTFCNKCIRRNFNPAIRKTIEDDEAWKCLVCDPKDLYTARAVCWALLQHVQTVTRILKKDETIPDEEFRQRMMNLDESRCCRKRRGKRRKHKISDSEGEDETYEPDVDELCLSERRKTNRKMPRLSGSPITNGEGGPKSPAVGQKQTRSRLTVNSFSNETEEDDLPLPMIPCVQSMIEGDSSETLNKTLNADLAPIPVSAPGVEGGATGPQPQINPIPTVNLLKPSLPLTSQTMSNSLKNKLARQLQRILPAPKPRMKMLMLKHSLHPTSPVEYSSLPLRAPSIPPNVPMVAIPAVSSGYSKKRSEISAGQSSPVNDSPVIEIDSDSDDTFTPEPSCEISEVNDNPDVVTLIQSEDEPEIFQQQELRINKQRIDMPKNTMENELELRTESVKVLFKKIGTELRKIPLIQLPHNNSLRTTRIKTRRFHLAIAKAISELNEINDEVINKYVNWRKVIRQSLSNDNADGVPSSRINYHDKEAEDLFVPLDMVCTNSGSEPDDDEELDLEEACLASKVRSISLFNERDTVDVGIGESFTTSDKSVQVEDVIPRDYEKCIGHSVLTKVEYDPTDGSEILKPVIVPAEYDGKYEEQFIFYLQKREESPIETDDEKGLPDPNETPLKDLIEANSPFVLEMLESIDSPLANGAAPPSADANIEETTTDCETAETVETTPGNETNDESGKENKDRTESTNVVKELAKIVTEMSEDLKTGDRNDDDSLLKKHSENGKKDKRKEELDSVDTEEVDVAVQALIEEDERSRSSNNDEDTVLRRVRYLGINDKASPVRASDDECTIID